MAYRRPLHRYQVDVPVHLVFDSNLRCSTAWPPTPGRPCPPLQFFAAGILAVLVAGCYALCIPVLLPPRAAQIAVAAAYGAIVACIIATYLFVRWG